jgi:tRNA (mo5U34)-methyltransferase
MSTIFRTVAKGFPYLNRLFPGRDRLHEGDLAFDSPERAARREHLRQLAESVPFWWHSIDLGEGIVTKGHKTPSVLQAELKCQQLPDLRGKTVLDIGAWDGFFSFEAERRGARRVMALDHYVWSLDFSILFPNFAACQARGEVAPQPRDVPGAWRPGELPGKRGFEVARAALDSRVEPWVGDYMEIDLAELGTFDVVFYLGVLYHMENPLQALKRVAALTDELAVIETAAVLFPGYEHVACCEFYESDELNQDVSNWWAPNQKALEGLCRAAGFSRVNVLTDARRQVTFLRKKPFRYRAIAHAWK